MQTGSCLWEERVPELLENEGWGTGGGMQNQELQQEPCRRPKPVLSPCPTVVTPFCHVQVWSPCSVGSQSRDRPGDTRSSSSTGASNLAIALCGGS